MPVGSGSPSRCTGSDDAAATGVDPRPKLLLLAEHDEFRPAAEVQEATAAWANTRVEVVGGASHYFVGRTSRLVELVAEATSAGT